MLGWFVRWLLMTLAIMAVSRFYRGMDVRGWTDGFLAAVLLSVANAFLRPIVVVLTLPINIVTLGLFTLVINGVLLLLVDRLLPGLYVHGFWSGMIAALFVGVLSFLLNLLVGGDGRFGRMRWERR